MTDKQDGGPYVIWSNEHKCWWAANECGYRGSLADAGRYSREHALKICKRARGGRDFNENPSEVPLLLRDAAEFWPDVVIAARTGGDT